MNVFRLNSLHGEMLFSRHARLERYSHAHPIHLRQDVARKVGIAVEVERRIDGIAKGREGPDAVSFERSFGDNGAFSQPALRRVTLSDLAAGRSATLLG